MTQLELQ